MPTNVIMFIWLQDDLQEIEEGTIASVREYSTADMKEINNRPVEQGMCLPIRATSNTKDYFEMYGLCIQRKWKINLEQAGISIKTLIARRNIKGNVSNKARVNPNEFKNLPQGTVMAPKWNKPIFIDNKLELTNSSQWINGDE